MSVVVDQLLHGYSNGHRLLAASIQPEAGLAARLLSHSDAPAVGDTPLLASLPMPERGNWALTSVWAADEIERPGSVWSHTLLLDADALAQLNGAKGLLAAFRRPHLGDDLGAYREPITVADESQDLASDSALHLAPSIVLATYGWPGRSTGVITDDLGPAGQVLLAIWQRQWPALRAEFRFRTRQRLGEEASGGVEVARRPSRRPVDQRINLEAGTTSLEAAPSWLAALCEELEQSPTPLENFLRGFGPEAPNGRPDVPALTRIEEALRPPGHPAEAMAILTRSYPEPTQMLALKLALVGLEGGLWSVEDSTRIKLAVRHAAALPWDQLEVPQRLANLWAKGRENEVVELLLWAQDEAPQFSGELLAPLAERVGPDAIGSLASASPPLAASLLQMNPALLATERLWSPPAIWQGGLAAALAEAGVDLPAQPFLDCADDGLIATALQVELVDALTLAASLAQGADDDSLVRWRALLSGYRLEVERALCRRDGGRWQEVALAVAAPRHAERTLVERDAHRLVSHLDVMGETVRLRVAAAIFTSAGEGAIDRGAVGRSFAALHKAPRKKLLQAQLDDYFADLERTEGKIRGELREQLVGLVVDEDWRAADIAYALTGAGPGAGKVRELTPKRSELRKLMNASWKMVGKGIDLAKRLT